MTAIEWGQGSRPYSYGVDRGVLYSDGVGVPWNGLISIEEDESAQVDTEYYMDGVRLKATQSVGDYKATLDAFTYPDEFVQHDDGTQTDRNKRFGLSWRANYGEGYRLHVVYNALARISTRSWRTNVNAISTFSWDIHASGIAMPGARPTSHLIIDTQRSQALTREVEDLLYGTETTTPRLPSPTELVDIFETYTVLRITYHGDGSYTAVGPDDMVEEFADGTIRLSSPTAAIFDDGAFVVDSY